MKLRLHFLAPLLVFLTALAPCASALILDFNREGSTSFSGATNVNLSSGTALISNLAVTGNVSFTLSSSISTVSADVFNRDRNSATYAPNVVSAAAGASDPNSMASFYRDFVGALDGAAYTFTFSNLAAGTYSFSSWHYDAGATAFASPSAGSRSLLLTDANGTAVNMGLVTKPAPSSGDTFASITPFTFQVTSNGVNPVIVTYGGTNTGTFVINGFEINPVPEPGAAGLLALAGTALVIRRRRKA